VTARLSPFLKKPISKLFKYIDQSTLVFAAPLFAIERSIYGIPPDVKIVRPIQQGFLSVSMFKYDSTYLQGWSRILGGQIRKNPSFPSKFNATDVVTAELIGVVAAAIGNFALSDMNPEWRRRVHAVPRKPVARMAPTKKREVLIDVVYQCEQCGETEEWHTWFDGWEGPCYEGKCERCFRSSLSAGSKRKSTTPKHAAASSPKRAVATETTVPVEMNIQNLIEQHARELAEASQLSKTLTLENTRLKEREENLIERHARELEEASQLAKTLTLENTRLKTREENLIEQHARELAEVSQLPKTLTLAPTGSSYSDQRPRPIACSLDFNGDVVTAFGERAREEMLGYCEKKILLAMQRPTPPSKLTLYDINDYEELGGALMCDLVKLRATWPGSTSHLKINIVYDS
jgi:hypothetical protein